MPSDLMILKNNVEKLKGQFATLLQASGIHPDKFVRVALTAISVNPNLGKCTPDSIYASLMKCATDGLLPDNRQAAIIPYKQDGGWRAQYQVMIGGIRHKIRASGEIKDLRVEVVYADDFFDYQLGDDPHIVHKPSSAGGGRSRPISHVYSIAVFNDGYLSRDVMSWDEIIEIRDKFVKAKYGPWFDPVSLPEMAKKTVVRHHAKILPMPEDALKILDRDTEDMQLDYPSPAKPPAPAWNQQRAQQEMTRLIAPTTVTPSSAAALIGYESKDEVTDILESKDENVATEDGVSDA